MRKSISFLALITAMVLTLSSCLSDNEESSYDYYGDTAITAFTLGTVNRYLTSTNAAGRDTTIASTVTGSDYAFVIDQAKAQIYNPDSLPYGCDPSAVLATITAKHSGYVYLQSMTSDSLTYYSSSDSIDFSKPRIVEVVAQDGARYRKYTVTVNVHQQMEGQFQWARLADFPATLTDADGMKAVALAGDIFLLASQSGTTTIYAYDGTSWTPCTPNINTPLAADAYRSAVSFGGHLYIATNGTILRTTDGNEWEETATATGITQLVAASSTELYALTATGLAASTDGTTWTTETLSSDASLLPATSAGYGSLPVKTNQGIERITFVGTQAGATHATAWTKLADTGTNPVASNWSHINAAGDTRYALPALNSLTVLPYNGTLLAFGTNEGALTSLYCSVDGGIAWKTTTTTCTLPEAATTAGGKVAAAASASNHIWIVTDSGQVWRGRLNELGWEIRN